MEKIRILVADDHPVVSAGLRALLRAYLDMDVVAEASDGASAVERTLELHPDVVIMDITMAGTDGFAAIREIKKLSPETKVLVLTIHDNEEYMRRAMELGATGYVLKQAVDTELAVAIRTVHRGEVFLYPSFARVLLGELAGGSTEPNSSQSSRYQSLSPREREVLRLVALGYTNRQIGDQLGLSVKTVDTYRARLMDKLGLRGRIALVRYALDEGLLDERSLPTAPDDPKSGGEERGAA